MTKKMEQSRKRGASIVEVLVALILFATFIGGAGRVIMAQHQVTDKARAHYTAINIAKNRIEQLRNMRRASYAQILLAEENDVLVDENGLSDANGKFSRTTKISETQVKELYELEITVKIKNPVTFKFNTEQEHVKSYMARLREST